MRNGYVKINPSITGVGFETKHGGRKTHPLYQGAPNSIHCSSSLLDDTAALPGGYLAPTIS